MWARERFGLLVTLVVFNNKILTPTFYHYVNYSVVSLFIGFIVKINVTLLLC